MTFYIAKQITGHNKDETYFIKRDDLFQLDFGMFSKRNVIWVSLLGSLGGTVKSSGVTWVRLRSGEYGGGVQVLLGLSSIVVGTFDVFKKEDYYL